MIRLTNTTDQPITATTGHTIPPGGTLDVPDATWDRICQEPYIAGQMRRGNMAAERAPEPEPEQPPTLADTMSAELADVTLTAYDLGAMRKDELIDAIKDAGEKPVDGDKNALRDQLFGLL